MPNLTQKLLPEPALPNKTSLAFSKLKRSNKIKELLCLLIPYKIPSLELKSKEAKGKVEDKGPVFIGVWTKSWSKP